MPEKTNQKAMPSSVSPSSLAKGSTTNNYLKETPTESTHKWELNTLQINFKKDPYLKKVVDNMVAMEERYSATHYPSYHALNLSMFVFTLFTRHLLMISNKIEDANDPDFLKLSETIWMRFPQKRESQDPLDIQSFLKKYPMVKKDAQPRSTSKLASSAENKSESTSDTNDHDPEVQRLLLCLNPFIFGNMFVDGEETWKMFLENRSVNPPDFNKLFGMLCDHFGLLPLKDDANNSNEINQKLRKNFAEKFEQLQSEIVREAHISLHKNQKIALENAGKTRQDFDDIQQRDWGVMCQFLLPKNSVDQYTYPSKGYGIRDLSFKEASQALDAVNINPHQHKGMQLRILTSALTNFNQGIIANAFGFENFFDSSVALPYFKEVQCLFLEMMLITADQNRTAKTLKEKALDVVE